MHMHMHVHVQVNVMLETVHDAASGWLKRPLRAVVQSVLRDRALHMELSTSSSFGDGAVHGVVALWPSCWRRQ